jgi:hypothetical protein
MDTDDTDLFGGEAKAGGNLLGIETKAKDIHG